MSTSSGYNGWTNYETWNVKLWLDNEENSSGYWEAAASMAVSRCTGDFGGFNADRAVSLLSEQLQNELEENAPDLGASCYADLLSASLRKVNWREIAEHYIADSKERAEA